VCYIAVCLGPYIAYVCGVVFNDESLFSNAIDVFAIGRWKKRDFFFGGGGSG